MFLCGKKKKNAKLPCKEELYFLSTLRFNSRKLMLWDKEQVEMCVFPPQFWSYPSPDPAVQLKGGLSVCLFVCFSLVMWTENIASCGDCM